MSLVTFQGQGHIPGRKEVSEGPHAGHNPQIINHHRVPEMASQEHITHWNANHSRGVRIDRVYANFEIEGKVAVKTLHHVTADHKGLLLTMKQVAQEPRGNTPPNCKIPHRAFDLPEIRAFIKAKLASFLEVPESNPDLLALWDVMKSEVAKFAKNT